MSGYTVEQIRVSCAQKRDWEKQFPLSRFVFRPLSFYAASAVSRLTTSAPAVAAAGFVIALSGLAALVMIGELGPWPGILMLTAYALSDAVDGNIARVTGSVTYYGRFLDGTLGAIAEGLFFPALGTGLHLAGEPFPFLSDTLMHPVAGLSVLVLMLYSAFIEGGFGRYAIEKKKTEGSFEETLKKTIGSSRYRGSPLYAVYLNGQAFTVQLLLLSVLAAAGLTGYFLPCMAAFYAAKFLVLTPYYLRRASSELS
jgi:phosphatidylglycerophosphate synthase